jgi:hypothetical protein
VECSYEYLFERTQETKTSVVSIDCGWVTGMC